VWTSSLVVLLQTGKGAEIGAGLRWFECSTIFFGSSGGWQLTRLDGMAIVFMITSLRWGISWPEAIGDRYSGQSHPRPWHLALNPWHGPQQIPTEKHSSTSSAR